MSDETNNGTLEERTSRLENRIFVLTSELTYLRGKFDDLKERRDALETRLGDFERDVWKTFAKNAHFLEMPKSNLADEVCREVGEEEKSSAKASVALLHQRLDKVGEKLAELETRLRDMEKSREGVRDAGRFAFERIDSLESWMDWVVDRLLGDRRVRFKVQSVFNGVLIQAFLSTFSDLDMRREYEDRQKVRGMGR